MLEFNLAYILVALYIMLAFFAGFQVARILFYRHNRFSFQLGFLVLCFIWTSLRVAYFFAVYPQSDTVGCWTQNLLFQLPVLVQFATFSLLVMFYGYWVHRAMWDSHYRNRFAAVSVATNSALFVLFLVWVAFDCTIGDPTNATVNLMTQLQEALSGCMFLLLAGALLVYGWRLYRLASSGQNKLMQVKQRANATWQIVGITTVIVLIFMTRAIHDFLGISPDFRQTIDHPLGVLDFVLFLFWEVTPTLMVLIFFRRIPKTNYGKTHPSLRVTQTAPLPPRPRGDVPQRQSQNARYGHLFDDMQRYDSDEERFVRSPSWSALYGTPSASLQSHLSHSASGERIGIAYISQHMRKDAPRQMLSPLLPPTGDDGQQHPPPPPPLPPSGQGHHHHHHQQPHTHHHHQNQNQLHIQAATRPQQQQQSQQQAQQLPPVFSARRA